MNNEIKINVPEGMEIDKENSTFECIKFKPKWIPKRGDIAIAKYDDYHKQIILIAECISQSVLTGFNIKPLAFLSSYGLSIYNNYQPTLWVKQEASASEKESLINKLKENGYIYDPNDLRVIYKKEEELPKTWKEFCENNPVKPNECFISGCSNITEVLSAKTLEERIVDIDDNLLPSREYAKAMLALCKLIQLRNCYNRGWEPDWDDINEIKYIIRRFRGEIDLDFSFYDGHILAFKTEELRKTFLNNFKDLIEQAKLLL